jgi:hypothetical protein
LAQHCRCGWTRTVAVSRLKIKTYDRGLQRVQRIPACPQARAPVSSVIRITPAVAAQE